MANDVSIVIGVDGSAAISGLKKIDGAIDNSSSKAGKFGSILGDVGKIAGGFVVGQGLLKVPSLLGGATSAASDLSENLSKAQVVFGDSAGEIEKFAQGAAKNLGISKSAALGAAGTFGNLFVALKLGQPEATKMSQGVLKLAADLGSFNNMDPTEVLEKLRAGLVGEAEPLRTLGININAATVEAKAMELGLAATTKELTEADKVQARYALILEQTTTAQGDFARTADGAANQQRILKAEMEDMNAKLGEKILPLWIGFQQVLLEKVIPAISQVAAFVQEKLVPALVDGFERFRAYYETNLKPLVDNIIALFQQVITWFQEHWPEIEKIVRPIMEEIAAIVKFSVDAIVGSLTIITALLRGDWRAAWEEARDLVKNAADSFVDSHVRAAELLMGLTSAFYSAGRAMATSLWDGLKEVAEIIGLWMAGLPAALVSALGDLSRVLWNAGKALMQGLANGIRDAYDSTVGAALKWVSDKIPLDKGPPEADAVMLYQAGKLIMSGLARGLADGYGDVQKVLRSVTSGITSVMDGSLAGVGSGGVVDPGGPDTYGGGYYSAGGLDPVTSMRQSIWGGGSGGSGGSRWAAGSNGRVRGGGPVVVEVNVNGASFVQDQRSFAQSIARELERVLA